MRWIAKSYSFALLGIVWLLPFSAATAREDPLGLAFLESAPEVADQDLAEMRGRFVDPNGQLVFFGIEMLTHWQTPNGEHITAGLGLQIDLAQTATAIQVSFQPVITIVPPSAVASGTAAGSASGAPSAVTSVSGNGLNNVNGVGQGIQVAGDNNRIRNDLRFNLTAENQARRVPNNSATSKAATPVTSVTSPGGTVTSVRMDPNELGVTVQVPGQGEVRQQIRGGGVPNPGVLQNSQISGNTNDISNQINIQAEIRTTPGLNASSYERGA